MPQSDQAAAAQPRRRAVLALTFPLVVSSPDSRAYAAQRPKMRAASGDRGPVCGVPPANPRHRFFGLRPLAALKARLRVPAHRRCWRATGAATRLGHVCGLQCGCDLLRGNDGVEVALGCFEMDPGLVGTMPSEAYQSRMCPRLQNIS